MVLTVIVLLLLLADAALVYFNIPVMRSPLTLTAPGLAATTSHLALAAGAAGAFVLIWLGGLVDRALVEQRVRQRDATLHAMGEELLRMKSAAYDQERPPLADVRARLEAMERDLQAIRARIGDVAPREREYQPEGTARERRP
jgi:hypothetical protein